MKVVRVHAAGGLEALRYEDVPDPSPGPGQALVKVEAAGVNFIDVYYRTGVYQAQLPVTLGQEGAGTVIGLGQGVSEVQVGDRVAFYGAFGTYAEQAVVPAEKLVPLPAGVDAKLAAAALLQGMTAQYLACTTFPLGPEHTCLIHAAAGGVGLLFCQVAKMQGARVLATISTEEKARSAREAGADEVILYSQTDFEAEVKRLTDGRGVDVVYDSVGATTFLKGLDCLRPRGMMVLFGQSSGVVEPVSPSLLQAKGSLFLTRPTLVHHVLTRQELLERAGQVFGWIKDGKLKVHIHAEYPLAEAGKAQAALENRETIGKLILIP
jgi:NADPH2:quinone reductase